MYSANIVKQFTKFIFPFRYSAVKTELATKSIINAKGKEIFLFEQFSQRSYELRQGLSELLDMNGGSAKIADCFALNYDARTHFGLPSRLEEFMPFYCRGKGTKESFGVAIKSVKVFLFESEVGFVEIECRYQSNSINDYINCNYFLCELKADQNIFAGTRHIWNSETASKEEVAFSFSMKDLVHQVLSHIEGVRDMKHDGVPEFADEKGIIYSYLLLDKKPENLDDLLFHLRKNYKESYQAKLYSNRVDPYVQQQFENSYWTASFNGAVNVSFLTDDKTTDSFFSQGFPAKLHDTYYSLFIHVLHQRYAIMKFMGDIGTLDKLEMDYGVMRNQLKIANIYKTRAANLKFRAFFLLPSCVEHINDYYNLLYRAYQIRNLSTSFNNDLTSLQELCDVYVARIKKREERIKERRKAKAEIFVSIFGTVVAVAALLNSYWGILEKAFGKEFSFWSAPVLLAAITLLLPVITIIVDVIFRVKDIRKITEILNNEVKDNLVEGDRVRRHRKRERKRNLEWVYCPYCKEGEGCSYDEGTGLYTCPTNKEQFTKKQSLKMLNYHNNQIENTTKGI